MYNLGAWLVAIPALIDHVAEHPYLEGDVDAWPKALGLVVVWFIVAVGLFLVVGVGGVLLVGVLDGATTIEHEVVLWANGLILAIAAMLLFVALLYGPRTTLTLLQHRAERAGEPD